MKKANLSHYDHLLAYKESQSNPKTFRSTQIIASIEKSMTKDDIKKMIKAGMAVARFDCSNEKPEVYENTLKELREAIKEYNVDRKSARGFDGEIACPNLSECLDIFVATALDVKGPTLKTGATIENKPVILAVDTIVILTHDQGISKTCDNKQIYIKYPNLHNLPKDQEIQIGDTIKLRVLNQISDSSPPVGIECKVEQSGEYTSGTDVTITNVKVELPAITNTFLEVLEFAKENNINMIFTPIQDPTSFSAIKCHINPNNDPQCMLVIAKLEGAAAVENIDKIIEKADGVLIARENLGKNMPPEKVIIAQKVIIAKCMKAGIPSIVTSHMLASLADKTKEATRAEISDIVNATLDGVDCTMLEKETMGNNFEKCIQTMQNTILETEQMINYRSWFRELLSQVTIPLRISENIAISACLSALVSNASAIIVLTWFGKSAKLVTKYRPECPVVIVTPFENTARQCLLLRGATSVHVPKQSDNWEKNIELSIESGLQFIHQSCMIHKFPSTVIAVLGQKEGTGCTNTIRVIEVTSKPEKQRPSQ